jgi:competence protein ComEA
VPAAVAIAAVLVLGAIVLHRAPPPAARVESVPHDADAARIEPAGRVAAQASGAPRSAAAGSVVVYVAGAVVHPGVYALGATARVVDALARAGGATGEADVLRVNLAAHLTDGEEIAVLRRGEAAPSTRRTAAPRRGGGRKKRRPPPALADATGHADPEAQAPLDLNSATADDLAGLPGLGPELAERIVAYREVNGPFGSVDELADVSGMTPARLDRLIDRLTVR